MKNQPKVIFISGASSGIGKAAAVLLSKEGHRVYGTSRSPKESPANYVLLPMDVTDEDSIAQALQTVLEREGRIDAIINNAGMGIAGPLELTTKEELDLQLDTNLNGAAALLAQGGAVLRKQGWGVILSVSSLAAVIPIPFQAAYSASKAGLTLLSRAMDMELRPFGVRISTILLGDTKTDFTQNRRRIETMDPVYNAAYEKSLGKMEKDEQNGMEPMKIAKKMARVLQKNSPPTLVVCGAFPKTVYYLQKVLPARWVQYLVFKLYC